MGIKMNLALCALVFLIRSSDIRGQSTAPHSLAPPLNLSEAVTSTAPIFNPTASASSNSSESNSTLSTPLLPSTTSNNSSNSSGITPVSTPQPSTQVHEGLLNQTATDLPITTTGSVGSAAPANGSGVTMQPTTESQPQRASTSPESLNISSPQTIDTTPSASVAHSSTAPTIAPPFKVPSQPTTTSSAKTSSPAPTTPHRDTPSELNVGDEEAASVSNNSGAPLDPLLAGLVSVFIVSAAIVSLLLFLKFRKRNEGPEFRRLQDLPMDDMMEDTPLSMFSY